MSSQVRRSRTRTLANTLACSTAQDIKAHGGNLQTREYKIRTERDWRPHQWMTDQTTENGRLCAMHHHTEHRHYSSLLLRLLFLLSIEPPCSHSSMNTVWMLRCTLYATVHRRSLKRQGIVPLRFDLLCHRYKDGYTRDCGTHELTTYRNRQYVWPCLGCLIRNLRVSMRVCSYYARSKTFLLGSSLWRPVLPSMLFPRTDALLYSWLGWHEPTCRSSVGCPSVDLLASRGSSLLTRLPRDQDTTHEWLSSDSRCVAACLGRSNAGIPPPRRNRLR